MTPPNPSPVEIEIGKINLWQAAIDPFGLVKYTDSSRAWKQAKEVDDLFVRKQVNLYYCPDCAGYIRCTVLGSHNLYVRCMGSGGDHCLVCSEDL